MFNEILKLSKMKTKLFALILILFLIVPAAMSQSGEKGKLAFAVLGGVNFQNINGKDWDGSKLANDLIIGYHGGVNVQIPLVPQFFFQPGLLFTAKGTKWSDATVNRLSYVELPLSVVYKGLLGKGYIMIGLGPYIGYAVMGKSIEEDGTKSNIEFTKTV